MSWAIVALSLLAIPVVLLTAGAHLGPGIRYSDVLWLCVALALFALACLVLPWHRLEQHWLLLLVGGPIAYVAGLNSLTGAGASPYFAIYAPILAIAGWYLSGRQTAAAIALLVATEAWRALVLDHSGSVDQLVIALPFAIAIAATASLTSRWLRQALAETRNEQVRLARTVEALRSLTAQDDPNVLLQLETAVEHALACKAAAVWLDARVVAPDEYVPAVVEGQTAVLLVKGRQDIHALLRLEANQRLSAQELRLAAILAEAAGRMLDERGVGDRTVG